TASERGRSRRLVIPKPGTTLRRTTTAIATTAILKIQGTRILSSDLLFIRITHTYIDPIQNCVIFIATGILSVFKYSRNRRLLFTGKRRDRFVQREVRRGTAPRGNKAA